MTAQENVGLALAFAGLRGNQRRKRAEELLDRVGLADRLTHRPSELSGGEQQRVAIARALANRPKVLLADEPTGNLDSTRAHELLGLLREMVAKDALTILMVTHDHELATSFADRIVLMKDGRVVNGEPTSYQMNDRGGRQAVFFILLSGLTSCFAIVREISWIALSLSQPIHEVTRSTTTESEKIETGECSGLPIQQFSR